MTLIDFLIIYLACGAPFGVYYFLKNRAHNNSIRLWLKTVFNFVFWIPNALLLFRRRKNFKISFFDFDKTAETDLKREKNLYSIEKRIEKILFESNLKISIYEFRETIERYVGLTLAAATEIPIADKPAAEIFRVSQNKNVELGSICLERRNRKRLSFHHTEARKDFLYLIEQLSNFNSDDSKKERLRRSASEFVENLNDVEAQIEIERMFSPVMQNDYRLCVKKSENDLWKPETRKPSAVKQTFLSTFRP